MGQEIHLLIGSMSIRCMWHQGWLPHAISFYEYMNDAHRTTEDDTRCLPFTMNHSLQSARGKTAYKSTATAGLDSRGEAIISLGPRATLEGRELVMSAGRPRQ